MPNFDPIALLAENRAALTQVAPQNRKLLEIYLLSKAAGVSADALKRQAVQWLSLFPSDRRIASLSALRARAFQEVSQSESWGSLARTVTGLNPGDYAAVKAYLETGALARITSSSITDNAPDPVTLVADNRAALSDVPPQDYSLIELYLLAKAANVFPSFLKEQAFQWLPMFPSDRDLAYLAALRERALDEISQDVSWASLAKLVTGLTPQDYDGVKAYLQSTAVARIQTAFGADQGNDPILGPPIPPVGYQLYVYRSGSGSLAPAQATSAGSFPAAQPPQCNQQACYTLLSWTVPEINLICTATYDGTPGHFTLHHPGAPLLPAISNFFVFCRLQSDVNDPVLFARGYHSILLTHNFDTSQRASGGATTAAQSGTTITLSGGSFTFTDTATDQGKFIEWGGVPFPPGVTIQAVIDPTHAIVDRSQTYAAATFHIWSPGPNIDNNDLTVPIASPTTPYLMSVWAQFGSVPNGTPVILASNLISVTVNSDNTVTINP